MSKVRFGVGVRWGVMLAKNKLIRPISKYHSLQLSPVNSTAIDERVICDRPVRCACETWEVRAWWTWETCWNWTAGAWVVACDCAVIENYNNIKYIIPFKHEFRLVVEKNIIATCTLYNRIMNAWHACARDKDDDIPWFYCESTMTSWQIEISVKYTHFTVLENKRCDADWASIFL
jgi:hypothetical protein